MVRYFAVGRALVLVAMLVGEAGRANGQEPSVAAEDHYRRAAESFQKGNYEDAVRELHTTYDLTPLPRLLFNLAQAYRKWGHSQEALEYYELFLRSDPQLTAELREEVEGYIRQLQTALKGSGKPQPADSVNSPTPSNPVGSVRAVPAPSHADAAPAPLYKRPWLWIVVSGVAVVGAVAAGVTVGTAGSPSQPLPAGITVYSW